MSVGAVMLSTILPSFVLPHQHLFQVVGSPDLARELVEFVPSLRLLNHLRAMCLPSGKCWKPINTPILEINFVIQIQRANLSI